MTDLGNQQHVEQRNKKIKSRTTKIKEALRWVLSDERGRRYLAHVIAESKALDRVKGITPNDVMFLDGVKSMGFKIFNDVKALDDPKALGLLLASVLQPDGDDDGGPAAADE
jgi:hypothetical protein